MLGSSPEMLVRVTGRKLDYRPIAGTHRRGRDEEEDQQLEQQMMQAAAQELVPMRSEEGRDYDQESELEVLWGRLMSAH